MHWYLEVTRKNADDAETKVCQLDYVHPEADL